MQTTSRRTKTEVLIDFRLPNSPLVISQSDKDKFETLQSACLDKFEIITGGVSNIFGDQNVTSNQLSQLLGKMIDGLKGIREKAEGELTVVDEKIKELLRGEAELDRGIPESSERVILYTLSAWAIIIISVVIAIIVLTRLRRQVGHRPKAGEEMNYALFLDIMTVFLLTVAILVLGLADKIDKQGLSALIGGISGYVLGRMGSGQRGQT